MVWRDCGKTGDSWDQGRTKSGQSFQGLSEIVAVQAAFDILPPVNMGQSLALFSSSPPYGFGLVTDLRRPR